ncbi:uncharacterized protein LOC105722702 isoform X4 [Aotus nancymaae]|uniref:uncharacterized protein LOC105722702 isoform X4 n=1 Tax=Aotus nancymaae TaxID=37293 RepID=UPI0030FEC989
MVSSSEPQKPPESWCRYDLAFMVSPCWSMAQDGSVIMGRLPCAGKEDGQFFWATKAPRVLESVWPCLRGAPLRGSGRGSCLERPAMCCCNRWLILPSNGVSLESWSQCGLASMVHLVLLSWDVPHIL